MSVRLHPIDDGSDSGMDFALFGRSERMAMRGRSILKKSADFVVAEILQSFNASSSNSQIESAARPDKSFLSCSFDIGPTRTYVDFSKILLHFGWAAQREARPPAEPLPK